jgi:hypothetical protein
MSRILILFNRTVAEHPTPLWDQLLRPKKPRSIRMPRLTRQKK